MKVFHFVIPSKKQPTVLVAELDNFGVFNILLCFTIFIDKPLRKSLNSETGRP